MKTFSIQYALFPLLLLLSGSSYWFLQVRSNTLQSYKNERLHHAPSMQQQINQEQGISFITPSNAPQSEENTPDKSKEKDFQEDKSLLPDVQLLKFILDKSKEGLPVLRLPNFLYN
jgi:hypothetical protein